MNIISDYGGLLAVLALIVGAGVYLYGTAKKGRRDYLRADNLDLQNSNTLLRQKVDSLVAEVKSLATTVAYLKEVATQTPEVKQLLKATTEQQVLTAKQHGEVITQLADLAKQISKMTTEFSHVATAITKNSKAQDANTRSRNT